MNNLILLISASIVTALVILTVGMGFIIGSKDRIAGFFSYMSGALNKFIHIFRRNHPETIDVNKVRTLFEDMHEYYVQFSSDWRKLRMPLFWAFMANFWEVMTIYVVYIAFGHIVNIGAIILAYAIANSAGFVSILPGGIGVYEALMTLVLTATGVPSRISLPVTVMYRVLNTIIQVPAGYIAYQRHLRQVQPDEKQVIEQLKAGDARRD